MKFSAPLVIKEIGYKQWEVMREFYFIDKNGRVIEVEKGFRCDLASVFRYFKSVVDTPSYWTQAAVVHDKLYDNHRRGVGLQVTRKRADQILIEGMEKKEQMYGIPFYRQRKTLVYMGVRAGGRASWQPGYVNHNNQEN